MENLESLRKRVEALEQRTEDLKRHTSLIERRLRWWRAAAFGVVVLSLSLPLSLGTAQEDSTEKYGRGLAQRVAALEYKLAHVEGGENEVVISGANLRIVNGLGSTDCIDEQGEPIPGCRPNGLGNLIVGYNELRGDLPFCQADPTLPFCTDTRTGSHNVVVGSQNNFSSFGGLVVGVSGVVA